MKAPRWTPIEIETLFCMAIKGRESFRGTNDFLKQFCNTTKTQRTKSAIHNKLHMMPTDNDNIRKVYNMFHSELTNNWYHSKKARNNKMQTANNVQNPNKNISGSTLKMWTVDEQKVLLELASKNIAFKNADEFTKQFCKSSGTTRTKVAVVMKLYWLTKSFVNTDKLVSNFNIDNIKNCSGKLLTSLNKYYAEKRKMRKMQRKMQSENQVVVKTEIKTQPITNNFDLWTPKELFVLAKLATNDQLKFKTGDDFVNQFSKLSESSRTKVAIRNKLYYLLQSMNNDDAKKARSITSMLSAEVRDFYTKKEKDFYAEKEAKMKNWSEDEQLVLDTMFCGPTYKNAKEVVDMFNNVAKSNRTHEEIRNKLSEKENKTKSERRAFELFNNSLLSAKQAS